MTPTNKYQKEIRSGVLVDVYDVLVAFNVTCPAVAHAVKKLLAAGQRGHKSRDLDLKEAIQAIERSREIWPEKPKFQHSRSDYWNALENWHASKVYGSQKTQEDLRTKALLIRERIGAATAGSVEQNFKETNGARSLVMLNPNYEVYDNT